MGSGSRRCLAGPRARRHPRLGLLHVVPERRHGRHGGLHPAGLVDARLGLQVAGGLEFQAFVRTSGDAGAEVEGLFETSTKPAQEKHKPVGSSSVPV